jgi:hypothetical protein
MFNKAKIKIGEEIIQCIKNGEINRLNAELQEKNNELNTIISDKEGCSKGLIQLSNIWTSKGNRIPVSNSNDLCIDDPIYGCITLDNELVPIYYHPIVSRLQHIKQLSFASPFPSATHTRLSHSLGVAHLMEEALKTIFHKNEMFISPITGEDLLITKLSEGIKISGETPIDIDRDEQRNLILIAKASALLHDIGHGPFSHTIDRFLGYFHKDRIKQYADKKFGLIFLNRYLKPLIEDELKLDYEKIYAILGDDQSKKAGYCSLISSILNSAGDVDRLDYLVRDSHFSGLPIGWVSARTIMEHMIPVKCSDNTIQLGFREEVLPGI